MRRAALIALMGTACSEAGPAGPEPAHTQSDPGARTVPAEPRGRGASDPAGPPRSDGSTGSLQSAGSPGARDAGPAQETSDLVDIAELDPTIRLDIRYATARNFTGVVLYPAARCLLRRDAARRLVRVQRRLAARGFGLQLWDCYRPLSIQKRLWQLVHDPRYVAEPVVAADGTPLKGSKHNRGAAVDLTLVRLDGSPLPMPTDHDDFSDRAHRGNRKVAPAARANAEVLEGAMVAEQFEPLPTEWWHFDAPGWRSHALLDQPIEPRP